MTAGAQEEVEVVYDPEAPPLEVTDIDDALREELWDLARLANQAASIKKARDAGNARVVPLLKAKGRSALIMHPVMHRQVVAGVREDETLVVEPGVLLENLIKHFHEVEGHPLAEAEQEAEAVWKDVLKPLTVDTKEGGLFQTAHKAGRIPGWVAAASSHFEKKAGYIQFTQPKPQQG